MSQERVMRRSGLRGGEGWDFEGRLVARGRSGSHVMQLVLHPTPEALTPELSGCHRTLTAVAAIGCNPTTGLARRQLVDDNT